MTITDAHVVLGRIPPHLLGGEIPLDVERGPGRASSARRELGLSPEAAAIGVLEISAWNQANALRQVTVKRGLDVRDFTLTTFGGSGSLLLCRLMDVLGIPTVLVPPDPGQRVGVRAAHRRREERLRADPGLRSTPQLDLGAAGHVVRRARRTGARRPAARGLRRGRARASSARPTCATSGRPSRCGCPVPDGPTSTGARSTASPRRSTPRTAALYGYDFAGDAAQQVEWVNLRVSGIGPITRPEIRRLDRLVEEGAPAPARPLQPPRARYGP